jgi:adenylate kinase family enzyme
MKRIKIAISGAHGTGKTTFLKSIKNELDNASIQCIFLAGLAKKNRLPIMRNQNIESTLWMVTEAIAQELDAGADVNLKVILVDRPVIDYWAYMKASPAFTESKDSPIYITLENLIRNWAATYDLAYQTVIDNNMKIEDNNSRDLDPEFRKGIEREMQAAVRFFNITSKTLTTANVETEKEFVLDYIKKAGDLSTGGIN